MTFYLFLADRHGTSAGARWATMGLAVKVAQSVSFFYTDNSIGKLTVDHMISRSDYVRYSFSLS